MDEPKPVNPAIEEDAEAKGLPLYAWVMIAVVLAIPCGLLLGADASWYDRIPGPARGVLGAVATAMDLAPTLIIRALGALAAPLVVLAILSAIVTNEIRGRQGARMMGFYLLNTIVAMVIGLSVSNLIEPGQGADLQGEAAATARGEGGVGRGGRLIDRLVERPPPKAMAPSKTIAEIVVEMVPRSIGDAFASNNLAQLVLITVAVGVALAKLRDEQRRRGETTYRAMVDVLTVGFELMMKVLLWVVALVPIAVFGVVAITLAREGVGLFVRLGWFIAAALIGCACQVVWYLSQLGVLGRYNPVRFLRGTADVVAMTFSTASTAATIPITLAALTDRLGVSRASSQLAACVGTNFNNDGTALYQAVAALFFAQAYGADLSLVDQVVVMMTTLLASVGAGGIPSGSFVTLPLIFAAVRLPIEALPLLLTIDWFLDRCRTTVNVLGDMTVAVLIDRHEPADPPPQTAPAG